MKVSLIEDNPLRVLGVYANSSLREIEQNKAQLRAFARVGQEVQLPLWLNGLSLLAPLPAVTEELLAQAQAQLSLQGDRDRYARFWFERDCGHAQEDDEAITLLNHNQVDEACQLWRKRTDFVAQKNLLLLSVLCDDWDKIAEYAAKCFERDTAGFRLFMNEVVTSSDMATSSHSFELLVHFVQAPLDKMMKRVLVDSHKRTIDEAIDQLKRTKTTDDKLLKQEIEKAYAVVSHVEALHNLLGDQSYVYSFYANEAAKTLLNAISQYMHLNYCVETDKWAADMVKKLCGYIALDEPERDKLLSMEWHLRQRTKVEQSSSSGDDHSIWWWFVILVLSIALARTCGVGRKDRKNKFDHFHNTEKYFLPSPKNDPAMDSLLMKFLLDNMDSRKKENE
jgi:hypothetical protein